MFLREDLGVGIRRGGFRVFLFFRDMGVFFLRFFSLVFFFDFSVLEGALWGFFRLRWIGKILVLSWEG